MIYLVDTKQTVYTTYMVEADSELDAIQKVENGTGIHPVHSQAYEDFEVLEASPIKTNR